jgi:acetyltransferase-like isoleucine patch superfamily enzyme
MIHSTAIVGPNVSIPFDSKVREWVMLRGNIKIGHGVDIYQYANIGWGTVIEDNVYFGAKAVTMNTRHIKFGRKNMKTGVKQEPVLIKRGARIAIGALILPGVVIGEECLIGVGSVVTKSTKPYSIYFGNPARYIGPVPEDQWLKPQGDIL